MIDIPLTDEQETELTNTGKVQMTKEQTAILRNQLPPHADQNSPWYYLGDENNVLTLISYNSSN